MAVAFSDFSEPLATIFTFKAAPISLPTLTFRRHVYRRSPKRSRPVADVDTLVTESKKKRRLRLMLITSRLSRPFSTPATHIVDRGSSKIAVWAKQKHLAPQALRKAAIMNRVRRKTLERRDSRKDSGISVGEDARREAKEAVLEEMMNMEVAAAVGLGPNAVSSSNDMSYSVPPSPLGLSNYDALDEEDDWYENYEDDEEDEEEEKEAENVDPLSKVPLAKEFELRKESKQEQTYYSDFNYFELHPPKDDEDEDEDNDPFHLGLLPSDIAKEKRPPSPPEDKLIELMKEQQREREITAGFLHFA